MHTDLRVGIVFVCLSHQERLSIRETVFTSEKFVRTELRLAGKHTSAVEYAQGPVESWTLKRHGA
jgi:hypothetical protein